MTTVQVWPNIWKQDLPGAKEQMLYHWTKIYGPKYVCLLELGTSGLWWICISIHHQLADILEILEQSGRDLAASSLSGGGGNGATSTASTRWAKSANRPTIRLAVPAENLQKEVWEGATTARGLDKVLQTESCWVRLWCHGNPHYDTTDAAIRSLL